LPPHGFKSKYWCSTNLFYGGATGIDDIHVLYRIYPNSIITLGGNLLYLEECSLAIGEMMVWCTAAIAGAGDREFDEAEGFMRGANLLPRSW